jgi:hypothetical protein
MRKTLSLVLYMLLVEVIAVYLVVFPVYAFQVSSSTTGYVRVASQAAVSLMLTAQRAASVASLAAVIMRLPVGDLPGVTAGQSAFPRACYPQAPRRALTHETQRRPNHERFTR